MSKKNNIAYVKPEEPEFLKRLKIQAGYKEGPTINTKREELPLADFDDDLENIEDEEPTVVVLQPGDLTSEEANEIKIQKEKEENNKPADLSQRVVFQRPTKRSVAEKETSDKSSGSKTKPESATKEKKSKKPKVVLSFDEDEDDCCTTGKI